jgi:Chlorophyll A-B binding protein
MKLAILASLISAAAAFAPAQKATTSTSLSMAFENELGAQKPLGFFDPIGLVRDGDQAKFDRLRFVEIKHGRICVSNRGIIVISWLEAFSRSGWCSL